MNDAYTNPAISPAYYPAIAVFYIIIIAFAVFINWRIYEKAGQPGWAAIIPVYNLIILMRIIGRSPWTILLLCIPIVNIVYSVIIAIDLAKAFGKSTFFGVVGLFLFSLIGYIILAFGDATYRREIKVTQPDLPGPGQPVAA